jgi:acyl-CoA reductase-like NAD-dependent aldehyde dehydrogenase
LREIKLLNGKGVIFLKRVNLLINQKEVTTDQYTEIRDPGRLTDVVGEVAQGTSQDVDRAVKAAHQAFLSWRNVPLHRRCEYLIKAADVLKAESSNLVNVLVREQGMLPGISKSEISNAISVIYNVVELAEDFFKPKLYEDEDSWVSVEKRPIGVIGSIIPWNAPIILTMQRLAPALVSGNTIVFKPSPYAPIGVSMALKKIAVLFPPGVINVVHGEAEVGSALTKHPLVRKVCFTGGGNTAKFVMKDAADTIKSVQLELGGNDPAIILDDVDSAEIIPKLIKVAFRRCGQVCFAIKRIYVPKGMYDSFYNQVCEYVNEYKIGHVLNENVNFGPLNNEQQFNYIQSLIDRTKQSSAKVTQLGKRMEPDNWNNGYYVHPTVVRDVDPEHEIVSCEQFGPIIPLVAYRTEEEVIRMANDTEYGLSSSVWSSDFEHALYLSRQIEAGMTYINGHGATHLGHKHMPFGGVKQSGIGRENSEVGLAEYIEYHGINLHK